MKRISKELKKTLLLELLEFPDPKHIIDNAVIIHAPFGDCMD